VFVAKVFLQITSKISDFFDQAHLQFIRLVASFFAVKHATSLYLQLCE